MLRAAQQAHQALQHALADRSHELVKTQAVLQRLQADAQASQATSQAHADKLQQQVHVTGAFKSEALAQIKQLTDTLASTTQEHQVKMQFSQQAGPPWQKQVFSKQRHWPTYQ